MLYGLLGMAVGVLMPSQSAINNRLRSAVASPWVMATISFLVGTLCLAILTWATVGTIGFDSNHLATQPGWLWIGGLVGVVAMTTTVVLLPIIGALYSTALNLTAQVLTTMTIDQFGWFGVEIYEASAWRLVGALIVLSAALLAVVGGYRRPRLDHASPSPIWYLVGLGVGICFGIQVAVNGQLTNVLGSAIHAGFISFVVGTIALLILLVITRPSLRITIPTGQTQNPWWMWLGGALGAMYVTGVAFLAPLIGSAATVIVIQTGIIAGSLAVDHFGLLSAPKKPVQPLQVIGLVVMVAGVIIMNAPELFA